MTKEQCNTCTYANVCSKVLKIQSALGMNCKQTRAKAAKKPKPKVPRVPKAKGPEKGLEPAAPLVGKGPVVPTDTASGTGGACTPQK